MSAEVKQEGKWLTVAVEPGSGEVEGFTHKSDEPVSSWTGYTIENE